MNASLIRRGVKSALKNPQLPSEAKQSIYHLGDHQRTPIPGDSKSFAPSPCDENSDLAKKKNGRRFFCKNAKKRARLVVYRIIR